MVIWRLSLQWHRCFVVRLEPGPQEQAEAKEYIRTALPWRESQGSETQIKALVIELKSTSPACFEILIVGNELLNGTILDTNSHWLSERINDLGEKLVRKTTIRDELAVISMTVKECLRRKPRWLICVGGLGPTFDDMTLEGVARALGVRTALTKESIEVFRQNINHRRIRMKLPKVKRISKPSLKMAKIPFGSTPLRNAVGSAPGVLIQSGSTSIVCLPGVPQEMKTIFTEEILPLLRKGASHRVAERWMRTSGVGESKLAPPFSKIASKYAPTIYIKSHPIGFNKESRSLLDIQVIANYAVDEEEAALDMLDKATLAARNAIIRQKGQVKDKTPKLTRTRVRN